MDIINIIDRLDALVNTSPKMPATRSRLVDAEKIMELVEQLRLAIPQDVKAAQEIIEKKDALQSQAQLDARRIRREADEEFRLRVDQSELMAAARRNAQELLEESERKASRIVEQAEVQCRASQADADTYVVRSLRTLEQETAAVLNTVRKGLDSLGATVRA